MNAIKNKRLLFIIIIIIIIIIIVLIIISFSIYVLYKANYKQENKKQDNIEF